MHITFVNGLPVLVNAPLGMVLRKLCRVDFDVDRFTKQMKPNSGIATIKIALGSAIQRVQVPIR